MAREDKGYEDLLSRFDGSADEKKSTDGTEAPKKPKAPPVVKKYLEKGDIITYWTVINGERVLNTHRIKQNNIFFDA